jgi:hypothetical protein
MAQQLHAREQVPENDPCPLQREPSYADKLRQILPRAHECDAFIPQDDRFFVSAPRAEQSCLTALLSPFCAHSPRLVVRPIADKTPAPRKIAKFLKTICQATTLTLQIDTSSRKLRI